MELSFQSRNRDAFDFNNANKVNSTARDAAMFQSRNRDAFDFNLPVRGELEQDIAEFQSRNRDAFDFNENTMKFANLATLNVSIS